MEIEFIIGGAWIFAAACALAPNVTGRMVIIAFITALVFSIARFTIQ